MAITASAVSRVVGVTVQFKDFNVGQVRNLPQRIALVGQGTTALNATYSTAKLLLTSAQQAATVYGYGSPLHLAARQLFPLNGTGIGSIPVTAYPMNDSGTANIAAGEIKATGTATETASGTIKIGGITVSVSIPNTTVADAALALIKTAIAAELAAPVIDGTVSSGVLPITAKWGGESGNDILLDVSELIVAGLVFSVTVMASGGNNPDVDTPLALIGVTWETIILNLLNYEDTVNLNKYELFTAGRWETLIKKGCFVFTGSHDSFATTGAATDAAARKDDKYGAIFPAPGSPELPFVIAARAIVEIAQLADNNPPQNYKGLLTGIEAGVDGAQFNYASLDATLKLGSCTSLITSDVIELNDTITTYHPDGDPLPAFRYIVDLVKLQNIVFNVRNIFESDDWKGAPLLPDTTPTNNATAKKPKDAKAALFVLADNLGLAAIISDPEYTKANTTAVINSANPKRLDVVFPVKLSGNTEIIDTTVNFGFYFPTA